MSSDLKKRIYQAQCIGNVEPIEHMVPYPNLRSLVDGQNIKDISLTSLRKKISLLSGDDPSPLINDASHPSYGLPWMQLQPRQ